VAEAEPGIAFAGRLPIRGTDDDGFAIAAVARSERDGLSGTGDSCLATWHESSTTPGLNPTAIKWENGLNGY